MKLVEQTSQLTISDPNMAPPEPSPDRDTPPADPTSTTSSAAKPKRVRTGCLTCRERHLKCDEGMPVCQNCKKSNRECKRGMRLNFIDTKVEDTQVIPPAADWKVGFQDESRDIASEYRGGAGRYAAVQQEEDNMDLKPDDFVQQQQTNTNLPNAPVISHQQLPPIMSTPPETTSSYTPPRQAARDETTHHSHLSTDSGSTHPMYTPSEFSYTSDDTLASQEHPRALNNPDEVLFMQVFIEEVGIWMDSMDKHKHVGLALGFLISKIADGYSSREYCRFLLSESQCSVVLC